MARAKREEGGGKPARPATSPDGREQEIAGLAYDLAEEQIRGGTASSQVITHFLKMGSTREQLERQRIVHENELAVAKREAMERQSHVEELFTAAIDAMRSYTGSNTELPDEE